MASRWARGGWFRADRNRGRRGPAAARGGRPGRTVAPGLRGVLPTRRPRAGRAANRAGQPHQGPPAPGPGTAFGPARRQRSKTRFGPAMTLRRVTPGRCYIARYKSSYDTDARGGRPGTPDPRDARRWWGGDAGRRIGVRYRRAPAVAAELAGLLGAAAGLVGAARAANTRTAYASDWARFAGWCAQRDLAALPATPATLGAYLTAAVTEVAGPACVPATLARWVAAVNSVSYTHLRAHETVLDLVCR